MTREVRSVAEAVTRAAGEGDAVRPIVGYGAVFGRDANIGGYFIERIAEGAFTKAIGRDDVRCLFNHSRMHVLARTASKTLRLAQDDKGLRYEADPPDATWARDLVVSIDRGDINQSSFGFRSEREEWDETGDIPVRTILEVELFDVSPVTYPAYDDTEVGLRAGKLLVEAREKGLIRSPGLVRDVVSDLRSRMEIDLRERQLPPAFRNT